MKNKIEIKDVNNINEKDQNYIKESSTQKMRNMDSVDKELNDKNKILNENVLELKEFEINSLDYEKAIILDKRNFVEYYTCLLKYNHPLLFSFAPYNDYNPRIIKIFLFFFSLSLDFNINALFFNDDTMHKIYEDKGEYNFLFQIPQILYSTIISRVIDAIIRTLSLSQDNISELKQEKEIKDLDIKYKKIIRILKIKFILFFIIDFIVLLFFWYYITCFCGIYINTQIHLIKDSFLSLVLGFLYPFILYLIPSLLRFCALRAENQNKKCLYKFSIFIENYLG